MATKDHQSEPIESASETLQRIFDSSSKISISKCSDIECIALPKKVGCKSSRFFIRFLHLPLPCRPLCNGAPNHAQPRR